MYRTFDLILAIVLMPIALFGIALSIVAIRLDSRGPVIFQQKRMGRDEKQFILWKLRTMMADIDNRPSHEAGASAVTRVGALLRKTKVDELPQLWNILKSEMSFVGPRPCLPTQIALIEERRKCGVFFGFARHYRPCSSERMRHV